MSRKSSLALIVPCYNESDSIPYFEAELMDFIKQFKIRMPDFFLSVIVVDNNSTDNSLALLRNMQSRIDCLQVEMCSNKGYGAALKHGFGSSTAEYLSFLDLDNTYPMTSLFELLQKLLDEDLDIVYGARIHKSSEISLIRYLGNQFYVLLLMFFFNSKLTDVCSGMRVFKGKLIREVISLDSNDLSFSIDFTTQTLIKGWRISECPILYRGRVGESKLSVFKDGFLFLSIIINKYFKKKKKNV